MVTKEQAQQVGMKDVAVRIGQLADELRVATEQEPQNKN